MSGVKRKANVIEDSDYEDLDDLPTLKKDEPVRHSSSQHVLSQGQVRPLRASLLEWYKEVHAIRAMPWRRAFHQPLSKDPDDRAQLAYQVWVSEIMCQQTQVATVIPYYNRWMEK